MTKQAKKMTLEEKRKTRKVDNGMMLNLHVPEGTIPAGMVGYWAYDDNKGNIDIRLAAGWEFVADSSGENITRISGGSKMHLMMIEKELAQEDDDLRMKNYRASIGESDNASLGVAGVESYTPNGATNKIQVTSDPFSN